MKKWIAFALLLFMMNAGYSQYIKIPVKNKYTNFEVYKNDQFCTNIDSISFVWVNLYEKNSDFLIIKIKKGIPKDSIINVSFRINFDQKDKELYISNCPFSNFFQVDSIFRKKINTEFIKKAFIYNDYKFVQLCPPDEEDSAYFEFDIKTVSNGNDTVFVVGISQDVLNRLSSVYNSYLLKYDLIKAKQKTAKMINKNWKIFASPVGMNSNYINGSSKLLECKCWISNIAVSHYEPEEETVKF
jgi:hypothetical protein